MKVNFVLFFPLVIGFILGCCTSVLCCMTHCALLPEYRLEAVSDTVRGVCILCC